MNYKTIKEEILFLDSLSNPTERDKQLSTEMQQLLQLRKTDVSGSYSKDEMISAAKYGYEFHKTTSFPEQSFEQCCKNNFLQHLTIYSIANKNRINKSQCVMCGLMYNNPNNDSDTCYECREPQFR